MISVLLPLLVAGATFLPQELPPININEVNALTGECAVNFRTVDMNGDGKVDLVFPSEVRFQRDGAFPPEQRAPLPALEGGPRADVWKGRLFLRYADRLEIYQWNGAAWDKPLSQALTFPDASPAPLPDAAARVRFDRFVQDLDGDGKAELAVPGPEGLSIYVEKDGNYVPATPLKVYPPLRVANGLPQRLWPPQDRSLAPTTGRMECRLILDGLRLHVVSRETLVENGARFSVTTYALDPAQGFCIAPDPPRTWSSEIVPDYVQILPRGAEGFDLLGGAWKASELSLTAEPIFTTFASEDGGKTPQMIRSHAFRPNCAFTDFDHDGLLDMVVEETGLVHGGVRENVTRFMTQSQITHVIRVYLRGKDGRFSSKPDFSAELTLNLTQPPVFGDALFRRYVAGELVNVSGDFNGDGRNDVAVYDQPGRLAVFFTQGAGVAKQPSLTAPIAPTWRFGVMDVDGDGRADVVASTTSAQSAQAPGRLYLTRETAP